MTSAGICEGFAGAGVSSGVLVFAGFAGLVAGTLAMAAVEYSKLRAEHDEQLALTGWVSARASHVPPVIPIIRTASIGALSMLITYLAGHFSIRDSGESDHGRCRLRKASRASLN